MGWAFAPAIAGVVFGCLIAIFAMYFKYKETKLKQAERLAAIEKGISLPPEKEKTVEERKRGLQIGGLITLFAGIGVFVSMYYLAGLEVAFIGAIPFAIGVGMLLASFLLRERRE